MPAQHTTFRRREAGDCHEEAAGALGRAASAVKLQHINENNHMAPLILTEQEGKF